MFLRVFPRRLDPPPALWPIRLPGGSAGNGAAAQADARLSANARLSARLRWPTDRWLHGCVVRPRAEETAGSAAYGYLLRGSG